MWFSVLTSLLLAQSISGNVLDRRVVQSTCARDNCLRSVIASNIATGPARGSADCSSFFRTTVTSSCTNFVTTTVATTTTTTGTNTITSTSTVTTTVTVTATPGQQRREAEPEALPELLAANVARSDVKARSLHDEPLLSGFVHERRAPVVAPAPTTCQTTTNSPSSVPAYASFCSGTARYSSACSCNGVTPTVISSSTTTTSTVSVTSTSMVAATTTVIETVTTTSTKTVLPTIMLGQVYDASSDGTAFNGGECPRDGNGYDAFQLNSVVSPPTMNTYSVPSNGMILSASTYDSVTNTGVGGASRYFKVFRPQSDGTYLVLFMSGVATLSGSGATVPFPAFEPLAVIIGDIIGVLEQGGNCAYNSGSDTDVVRFTSYPNAVGSSVPTTAQNILGERLNVAAVLQPTS